MTFTDVMTDAEAKVNARNAKVTIHSISPSHESTFMRLGWISDDLEPP